MTDSDGAAQRRGSVLGLMHKGSTQLGLFVIVVALCIFFSSMAPGFISRFSLNSLGRSLAIDIVIGFAQMAVLATGGMNLSVGAIGVCAVMLTGYLLQTLGLPIPLALAGAILGGAALGWLNGFAIVRTGVNSFIVTLASASLFSGGMLILTKAVPFNALPTSIGEFGKSNVAGIPSLMLVAVLIGAGMFVLYRFTRLGRDILAAGANARAAEMSGVRVGRAIVFSHALSGALAAAAGIMLTARLGAAMPSVGGDDWLMPSFLAPVLGGTLLTGGMVSVIGTMLGAALVSTIRSGLLVLQVGNFWFQLFLGVILLCAVLLERYRASLSLKRQTRRA